MGSDKKKEEFVPSERLVKLVFDNISRPDDPETAAFLEELRQLYGELSPEEMFEGIKEMITREVEGAFISLAKHFSSTKSRRSLILSGDEFLAELREELMSRFDLRVRQDFLLVLNAFVSEITCFLLVRRERVWGTIYISDFKAEIIVKSGAFKLPEFPKPDDSGWKIS